MSKTFSVIHCNFLAKKVVKVENFDVSENLQETVFSMPNFRPMPINGNFHHLSGQEIIDHSNYLLKYIDDLDANEIEYFINQGVLDAHKAYAALNMRVGS